MFEGIIFPDPFVGANEIVPPEQIVEVCGVTLGVGLTTTVTLNELPVQDGVEGSTA